MGSELVTFGVYWITGLLFLLIDVYQPKSLVRYKVQPDASLDYGKLQTMLRRVYVSNAPFSFRLLMSSTPILQTLQHGRDQQSRGCRDVLCHAGPWRTH